MREPRARVYIVAVSARDYPLFSEAPHTVVFFEDTFARNVMLHGRSARGVAARPQSGAMIPQIPVESWDVAWRLCIGGLRVYRSTIRVYRSTTCAITPVPTVLRRGPHGFVFFSLGVREPPHIHVLHESKLQSSGFCPFDLREIGDSRRTN